MTIYPMWPWSIEVSFHVNKQDFRGDCFCHIQFRMGLRIVNSDFVMVGRKSVSECEQPVADSFSSGVLFAII